jgi:hypothetical protein
MKLWASTPLVLVAFVGVHSTSLDKKHGHVSFLELRAESLAQATMKNGPLFAVNVQFDWEHHDPATGVTISMDTTSGALKMVSGMQRSTQDVAWGYHADDLSKDGWIKLFIETTNSEQVSNDVRVYAAGFLEGLLTATRMSQFYSNFYQTLMRDQTAANSMERIKKVFSDELEFVKTNSNFHAGTVSIEPMDPYWKHMRYQFVQMWGVKDGYNFVAMNKGVRQLDILDMMIINTHAELPELLQAYTPEAVKKRKEYQKDPVFLQGKRQLRGERSRAEPKPIPFASNVSDAVVDDDWELRLAKHGHCSALVRVAPENKDILVGHTTWGDYAKMTRIFKYYNFHLPGAYTKSTVIGFSSYPGCISSTDDYYLLDSGLVVMDTSLEILNTDIYNRVAEFPTNSHVPNFMHIMTANRMAQTAPHWAVLLSERNSGTNNAQWMIIDYNQFVPKKPLLDNTLWVVEQVPGMTYKKDMTASLRDKGYWASYNRPYFDEIRKVSGHTAAEAAHGALYSYADGPRATIFKTLAPLTEHLMDMRNLMTRNAWPGEGVLPNSPGHAISSRMDLSFSKIPNGGIDAKLVNRCLFRGMQCQAISGPSHDSQKPFSWMDGGMETMKGWPHMGLPDLWDFGWIQMSPTAKLNAMVDVDVCPS